MFGAFRTAGILTGVRDDNQRVAHQPLAYAVALAQHGAEHLLITGPNGSGKTTTVRMLLGLVLLAGLPEAQRRDHARRVLERGEQLPVVLGRLREPDPGIEDEPCRVDPGADERPDAAVELGEDVGAAVSLREGASGDLEEIKQYVKDCVAAYKYPRTIWVLDELPKGPTGKILRRSVTPPSA